MGEPAASGSRFVVRGLSLASAGRRRSQFDVELAAGQLCLVGGRTPDEVSALLSACAGLEPHGSGEILVDGTRLPADVPPSLLGYAGRLATLVGTLTPVENLMLTAYAEQQRPADVVGRAEAQLAALGLGEATWHNLVEQLSGGQRQRVALARVLVAEPTVLVLDLPTSDLDPDNVDRVAQLLAERRDRGTCVLLATDDPRLAVEADLRVSV